MAEMDSVIMNSLWNGDQERFRYVSFEKVDMDADICVRRTLSCKNDF